MKSNLNFSITKPAAEEDHRKPVIEKSSLFSPMPYPGGRIPQEALQKVVRAVFANRLFGPKETALVFFDLDQFAYRANDLITLFPEGSLHAAALKSNPLGSVLAIARELGLGTEVASFEELYLAEKAGYAPENIVYDSPVKTREELRYALSKGIHINADSIPELERIAEIRKELGVETSVCLRVNPQVGPGKIRKLSVGDAYSKFGEPVIDRREAILDAFRQYPWLRGIHVHSVSQGGDLKRLSQGVRVGLDLLTEIRAIRPGNAPDTFDIGGGLHVPFSDADAYDSMSDYVAMLKADCPELFSDYRIITEFGRAMHANSEWAMSRIEYVKDSGTKRTLCIHLGADMFMRKSYHPTDWHHELLVVSPEGEIRQGNEKEYVVAGPLCFAQDILERDVLLPEAKVGDFLVIRDTGANSMALWSRHCSRAVPAVYGYRNAGEEFTQLKRRESLEDVLDFWS